MDVTYEVKEVLQSRHSLDFDSCAMVDECKDANKAIVFLYLGPRAFWTDLR